VEFKDLLRIARVRWKSIAVVFLLAVFAAAAYSFAATPIYHSKARLFISTDVSSQENSYAAAIFSQQRVTSYADLAKSGEVLSEVIRKLNLDMTSSELAGKISASVPVNTVIIEIEAKDPSARAAQQIAQAEAEALSSYIGNIETPTGKNVTPVKATITDAAQFDGSAISPRTTLNLAAAAVLGLLLGCALATARDLLDTTIKAPADIEAVVSTPVMAHVAYDSSMHKWPLLTDAETHSQRSEAFRLLRTNLQFLDLDRQPRSLVITSAVPGEGKTSTATNLAIAFAQAGRRVLLVDCDLRRPRIAGLLGLESAVGLTTTLVGRSDLSSSIQQHHDSGVHFLASGPLPPNPTEILQSGATRDLFKRLRDLYDVVIVDAPPLLPVADAGILATDVDGAIVVVRHGKTTREQLKHAMVRLEQVGARTSGLVVNMTPSRARGYGYGYGYGYASTYTYAGAGTSARGRKRAAR
jgi:receptor protein-tyrosine kinase